MSIVKDIADNTPAVEGNTYVIIVKYHLWAIFILNLIYLS